MSEEDTCFPDCASIGLIDNIRNMATDFSFIDGAMDVTAHQEYFLPPPPPPPPSPTPTPPSKPRTPPRRKTISRPSSRTSSRASRTPPLPTSPSIKMTNGGGVTKSYYKLEPRYNKLTGMTRRQWTVGLRGLNLITCNPCWKRFREDESRLVSTNEGQTISIKLCPTCVKHNRTHRFD